jgi:hypothetical protein
VTTKSEISQYLDQVLQNWNETRTQFSKNLKPRSQWPIPFFGNPATATVATVGVNPSATEFAPDRNWKAIKGATEWKLRLRDYFKCNIPRHEWFTSWQLGLEFLDVTYEEGTAAHFDVSYRSTTAMLKNPQTDPKEFRAMVENDVRWLFHLLPLCRDLRVLLIFGPIVAQNGRPESLFRFLLEFAPAHGFSVVQDEQRHFLRHLQTGRDFVVHEADTPGESCITCRVARNLMKHKQTLKRSLAGAM